MTNQFKPDEWEEKGTTDIENIGPLEAFRWQGLIYKVDAHWPHGEGKPIRRYLTFSDGVIVHIDPKTKVERLVRKAAGNQPTKPTHIRWRIRRRG